MNQHTAEAILYLITALGVVFWLLAARFFTRSFRTPPVAQEVFADAPPPANWLTGTAEVDGQPDALSVKAAAALVRPGGRFGAVRILSRTEESLAFESATRQPDGSTPSSQVLCRGQLRFEPICADRTRIDYAVEMPSGLGLWIGGIIFVALGLVALGVGFWAIATYVTPSPIPAVRAQVFQMLQVFNVLWPPFLFGGLQRQRWHTVRSELDTLVHNLPYMESASS